MLSRAAFVIGAAVWLAFVGSADGAAQRQQTATLRVVVKDPSGAVIPGALLQVRGPQDPPSHGVRDPVGPSTLRPAQGRPEQRRGATGSGPSRTETRDGEADRTAVTRQGTSDAQGVAVVSGLVPGRYALEVSFPGFETLVVPDLRLPAGDNRRDAMLAIQKVAEDVSVGRDPATAASDPNSDRFSTVLSRDQIDALPDDPDEMERVLKEMAGPGATIRVDGFRGGKLPSKSQIRSIRFSRDMLAAEHHGAGMVFVDIVTQPGVGPLRGSMDFLFRDDSLNARNAFQPAKGPERTQQYSFSLNGTLRKERTSFSLAANGASLYDSANVFAALPDGSRAAPIRRPADRTSVNGRLDHAITNAHTLRFNVQQNDNDQRNLGVGSYDLPDRAYARATTDRTLRVSENGPFGRSLFAESRLQLRWGSTESTSDVEAPTIRVLDAFTSGGAQQAGGRESTELEWAANVDWAQGRHALRTGALVEAGWYGSDRRTNYLGTYTFTSLADYERGRPANYTRRTGDPLVEFSHVQTGVFVQDDWRARSNLTISAGLRQELVTRLPDRMNLAPRAGFTWSPFKHGRTTVRGGGGVFYDWLEADTVEQTLRVDGARQQELVISNPGFPDPFSGGASHVLPASKYVLSQDLVMPYRLMLAAGMSHQLSPALAVNVNYNRMRGYNRLRGRNVNAPLPGGGRPDPAVGNVTQVESTAGLRGGTFSVGVNVNAPARRAFLFVNYARMHQENDADGPFGLPANNYDLAAEWGPAAGIPRHIFSAMGSTTLIIRSLRVSAAVTGRAGTPYNVTTGRDDNGDTVFNDRPAGEGRNSRRGAATWETTARVSYAFGFGQRPPSTGSAAGGQMVVHRVGPGAPGNDLIGTLGAGGAEDKRVRFELFASASNLLNHVNRIGYSGVMTSPFFGTPTAAMPGRRIDVGLRVGF